MGNLSGSRALSDNTIATSCTYALQPDHPLRVRCLFESQSAEIAALGKGSAMVTAIPYLRIFVSG